MEVLSDGTLTAPMTASTTRSLAHAPTAAASLRTPLLAGSLESCLAMQFMMATCTTFRAVSARLSHLDHHTRAVRPTLSGAQRNVKARRATSSAPPLVEARFSLPTRCTLIPLPPFQEYPSPPWLATFSEDLSLAHSACGHANATLSQPTEGKLMVMASRLCRPLSCRARIATLCFQVLAMIGRSLA